MGKILYELIEEAFDSMCLHHLSLVAPFEIPRYLGHDKLCLFVGKPFDSMAKFLRFLALQYRYLLAMPE